MKNTQKVGFADYLLQGRKVKTEFFDQMNNLIDWRKVSNIINKNYSRGKSNTGLPSHDGLVIFKMMLLQTWYGLSDYEVEERVNDSISISKFTGVSMDENAPDHSTISRFRTEMTEKK